MRYLSRFHVANVKGLDKSNKKNLDSSITLYALQQGTKRAASSVCQKPFRSLTSIRDHATGSCPIPGGVERLGIAVGIRENALSQTSPTHVSYPRSERY